MKKIAITGSRGMLGKTLAANLRGFELFPLTIENCDITQGSDVEKTFSKFSPDVVIVLQWQQLIFVNLSSSTHGR